MQEIKQDLIDILENTMIPESTLYLEELKVLEQNDDITEEETEALKDMEAFLDELHTILFATKEDKLNETEMNAVYTKISTMLEEHEEEH